MQNEYTYNDELNSITAAEQELPNITEDAVKSPKYEKRVVSAVTDINNELNKILRSSSSSKNLNGIEGDLIILQKKINDVRKAFYEKKNLPELSSSNAEKIYIQLDKLIEISQQNEILNDDKEKIITEVKGNLHKVINIVATFKKALAETKKPEGFSLAR